MKAKILLTSLIAGLALFAASAGIASANDPEDDDHHSDRCDHDWDDWDGWGWNNDDWDDGYWDDDDRDCDDRDRHRHHDFNVSYCWNILTCDFNHGGLIIVFVWVPAGSYYPGMTLPAGAFPGYPGLPGYPGGYQGGYWMPGMGY